MSWLSNKTLKAKIGISKIMGVQTEIDGAGSKNTYVCGGIPSLISLIS